MKHSLSTVIWGTLYFALLLYTFQQPSGFSESLLRHILALVYPTCIVWGVRRSSAVVLCFGTFGLTFSIHLDWIPTNVVEFLLSYVTFSDGPDSLPVDTRNEFGHLWSIVRLHASCFIGLFAAGMYSAYERFGGSIQDPT